MTNITLPCGLLDSTGTHVTTTVDISEFTAKVKKELANKQLSSNENYEDIILRNCIKAIGDNKTPSTADIRKLHGSDRDYIIMKIRQLSFGDKVKGNYDCSGCGTKMQASISIDNDFSVYALKPLEQFSLEQDPISKHMVRTFSIKDEVSGHTWIIRYDTGDDRTKAISLSKSNPFEAKMRLIGLCTIKIDKGDSSLPGPISLSYIENLPSRVWDHISNEWDANQAGLDTKVKVSCSVCGSENIWEIDPVDFFSMAPQTEGRKTTLLTNTSGS